MKPEDKYAPNLDGVPETLQGYCGAVPGIGVHF